MSDFWITNLEKATDHNIFNWKEQSDALLISSVPFVSNLWGYWEKKLKHLCLSCFNQCYQFCSKISDRSRVKGYEVDVRNSILMA